MVILALARKYFVWVVLAIWVGSSLLLVHENPSRTAVVICIAIFWVLLILKFKQYGWPSLLTLLVFLPFNITYQLPEELFRYDPYTNLIVSNYLIPTVSVIDALLLLVLAGLLLDLLPKIKRSVWIIAGTSAAYFTVHFVIHQELVTAIASFRYFMLISILSIALFERESVLLKFNEIKDRLIRYKIFWVVGASVVLQILIACQQIALGSSVGLYMVGESSLLTGVMGVSFWTFAGEDILRGYGTFPHPNIFAGYLLAAALLFSLISSSGFSISKRRYVAILIKISVYVLLGFGILLTLSRAALASYTLLLLLLALNELLMKYRNSKKNRSMPVMSITLPVLWGRLSQLQLDDTSVQDRGKLISAAIAGIKDNFWFGTGSGYSVKIYDSIHLQSARGFSLIQPVHNIFLLILLEHGVIAGAVIVLSMLSLWLTQLIRSSYKLLAVAAIAAMLIVGMLDHYMLTLPQGIAIFLLMNLILIFSVKGTKKPR